MFMQQIAPPAVTNIIECEMICSIVAQTISNLHEQKINHVSTIHPKVENCGLPGAGE